MNMAVQQPTPAQVELLANVKDLMSLTGKAQADVVAQLKAMAVNGTSIADAAKAWKEQLTKKVQADIDADLLAAASVMAPPAPSASDYESIDDIPSDDDELVQQSFTEYINGIQSKIISPRKVFEGQIVLKLTGDAPKTQRTNFNEKVRRVGADGKMADVYEKNPDGSTKLVNNVPIPVIRKKVQVLVPCIGKDGVKYSVAQSLGFKKALGDYLRKFGADGVHSFWKLASLASKPGDADVIVIEKVA